MKALLAAVAAITFAMAGQALAADCSHEFQHAYEKGVTDGHTDAAMGDKKSAKRHRPHLDRDTDRGGCYMEGYSIGYENGAADAKKKGRPKHSNAPTKGSNERAYYDDGCRAGTSDAKDSMSSVYERYSDDYDKRFEPYFKKGYEICWKHYR